jgi:glycosyltransferase involved in cell wall biosynthesis
LCGIIKKLMKFFIFGLPHTKTLNPVDSPFTTCAFTSKVWYLCRMMYERGHEVIHLGTEGSNPICTKHISVTSHDEWFKLYGHRSATDFYNIDTDKQFKPYMEIFTKNSRKAIEENCKDPYEAIVCITWGGAQNDAVIGLDQFIVESGVGYPCCTHDFRIYESYAWMHRHLKNDKTEQGKWYQCVIPNAFDPGIFYLSPKKDYVLYIGRIYDGKGVDIACDVTNKLGYKLKLAGQGDPKPYLKYSNVEYVGPVGVKDRSKLLSEAVCIMCPTKYIEPFGGVAVEAMLSGTPVISSDWGAFTETVLHDITGYRCRTLNDFYHALKNIKSIDPNACRKWAFNNYSLNKIGEMYETYFKNLLELKEEGWNKILPENRLEWIIKKYP